MKGMQSKLKKNHYKKVNLKPLSESSADMENNQWWVHVGRFQQAKPFSRIA